MIDRTFLHEALCEFVVLGDTHSMLPASDASREMRSRDLQTDRAKYALELAASLDPAFVVHLGDLVQEFPESLGFLESLERALDDIARFGLKVRFVAGNHDVGDKPDPTMPTAWATGEALGVYHARVGPSWYSWNLAGWHFVVLNTQIMNSGLDEEREQRIWFESDLRDHVGCPIGLFLHMAPFLVDRTEPWLGHYDNVGEPARSWLLKQVESADVRAVFAGHSHFQFFNRVSEARLYGSPSTSFTRPGFSEIFSSSPPSEQGRNDVAKLGFQFVRIHRDRVDVHMVRTQAPQASDIPDGQSRVLTRVSSELPDSPLGLIGRLPLAPSGEVPVAWPSMIRQPMRNDYPLLACTELGVRHLSVPATDLADKVQGERLIALREEGVDVGVSWIWSPDFDLAKIVQRDCERIDSAEVLFPDCLLPGPDELVTTSEAGDRLGIETTITPLMPKDVVPGKQHARARLGYRVEELATLEEHLREHGIKLRRISCRVDPWSSPWDVMTGAGSRLPMAGVDAVDWRVEIQTLDEREQVSKVTEAMLGAALQPGCRVYIDPFVGLDRTMDIGLGLLDRQFNPRPAFQAIRLLNSVVFSVRSSEQEFTVDGVVRYEWGRAIVLRSRSHRFDVCLPDPSSQQHSTLEVSGLPSTGYSSEKVIFDLHLGTNER